MKNNASFTVAAFCVVSTLAFNPATAFAQGSLTPPPGPISPVMKSLDQIEARTPVNSLPGDATTSHLITLPGSYYLTGPLNGASGKSGIRIEAVNVTLDLNGFTLEGVGGSTTGIDVNIAGGPVKIRNGQLRFWTTFGITLPAVTQFVLEDLQISNIEGPAISAPGDGVIERVSISNVKGYGIVSDTGRLSIRQCKVRGVKVTSGGAVGISATYADINACEVSTISGPDGAVGIAAWEGTVANSTVSDLTSASVLTGIRAQRIDSCRVSKLDGGADGVSTGISHGAFVVHSQVEDLLGLYAYGITGDHVQQCDVRYIKSENNYVVGISARRVQDCSVLSVRANNANYGVGISLDMFGMAVGNHVAQTKSHGIVANSGCVISDNVVQSVGSVGAALAIGIAAGTKIGVRIEGNTAIACGYGIQATAASAMVVRNNAGLCDTNFVLTAAMPVVTSAALGTNPNANVSQ